MEFNDDSLTAARVLIWNTVGRWWSEEVVREEGAIE